MKYRLLSSTSLRSKCNNSSKSIHATFSSNYCYRSTEKEKAYQGKINELIHDLSNIKEEKEN